MTTTTDTVRACVRCVDCLDVAFCDAPVTVTHGGAKVISPAWVDALKGCPNGCGGRLELMGRVVAKRCYRETEVCACDERCTAAKGPSCNCACKGANHGTGRTITVLECGTAVPRGEPEAKAIARARGYRAAREIALARIQELYGDVIERKARGEYVQNWSRFLDARDAHRDVAHARGLRTHAGRMKALEELIERLKSRS